MNTPDPEFLSQIGRMLNAGQSRSIVVTGNIYDLFYLDTENEYVSLIDFLAAKWCIPDVMLVIYEINGPIRFARNGDMEKLRDAWLKWRVGLDSDQLAIRRMLSTRKVADQLDATKEAFEGNLQAAIGNPTLALEFLRQMCLCARTRTRLGNESLLIPKLLIIVEGADLIIPEGEITNLSDVDRHRISICHDWFSDPGFINGEDSAVLLTESRSLLNHRVARLPQVLEAAVPAPNQEARGKFIAWFSDTHITRSQVQLGNESAKDQKLSLWGTQDELAKLTAGLSLHAIMQLLKGATHENRKLLQEDVVAKVEDFIQSQLGEDVVEFKKPSHTLEEVIGYERMKTFLREELIPRFASSGDDALPGAAVCGPIGGGKTFIFEAVAAELDMVVLVLKNIRSQWFGQTDVIFERLRRVLEALTKVVIFVDEADTQFGSVGPDAHETERRLTGKIQAMMSDTRLRGRVIWLLMTARIHLLSPDIRRPGRTGDLIIPVLDPEGDDRNAFIKWVVAPVLKRELKRDELEQLETATRDYAAASFASLRSELKAQAARHNGALEFKDILAAVDEMIPPAIGETRRYQILQALVNCTRKSLLPNPKATAKDRQAWHDEIARIEATGRGL